MKENLTVLVCANGAGTHRLKLLVIGKSAKTLCLDGMLHIHEFIEPINEPGLQEKCSKTNLITIFCLLLRLTLH